MDIKKLSYEDIREKTKILGYYDVLVNENDEVLIGLNISIPGECVDSKFYYDGGEHAFLVKNNRSIILCDYINEGARSSISKAEKILFMECTNAGKDIEEYEVNSVKFEGLDSIAKKLLEDLDENED